MLNEGQVVTHKEKHAKEFRKRWKKVSVKNGRLIAIRKALSVEFLIKLDKTILKEMGIDSFKIKKLA